MTGPRWGAPSVSEALSHAREQRQAGPSGNQYVITLAEEVERLRTVVDSAAEHFEAHGLPRRADAIRRKLYPPNHSRGGMGSAGSGTTRGRT